MDGELSKAIRHHKHGRVTEAEVGYLRVLKGTPGNTQVTYLLGCLYFQQERYSEALEQLETSIRFDPHNAAALDAMGSVLGQLQRPNDALKTFKRALDLEPNNAEFHLNLGRVLVQLERYEEAVPVLDKAIAHRPAYIDAINGLATALKYLNRPDEAIQSYMSCLELDPSHQNVNINLASLYVELNRLDEAKSYFLKCLKHHPESAAAWFLLGNVYRQTRQIEEAKQAYSHAIAIEPDHAKAHDHLGGILFTLGKVEAAQTAIERAIELNPTDYNPHTNLGRVLERKGEIDQAIKNYRKSLDLNPDYADAHNNLANALRFQEDFEGALKEYDIAIALKPPFPGAQFNKAMALFPIGRLEEAWRGYAQRFGENDNNPIDERGWNIPVWSGQDLANKSILLWTEQGVGDEILYSSMIPEIIDRSSTCTIECSDRLVPLFTRSFTSAQVLPRNQIGLEKLSSQSFDYQCAVVDLGGWLRPDFDSFPAHSGYAIPDRTLSVPLREKYEQHKPGNLIVGISWQSTSYKSGPFKTISLIDWEPILRTPDVTFVNLQYGNCSEELIAVNQSLKLDIIHDRSVDPLTDLDNFAAQVAAMDMVISTSNTTVHFAGAMNLPVWTLAAIGQGALPYWYYGKIDSPWYPSMRLYFQTKPKEWNSAIEAVSSDLRSLVAKGREEQ